MIKSEKKLAELQKVLKTGNPADIQETITSLRNKEPFEGAVQVLASFYEKTQDDSTRLVISEFFNDLKERSSAGEVIKALLATHDNETAVMLAASCWESGIDYSEHADALIEVFKRGDYRTSLECFTVLETCSFSIPEKNRIRIVALLEKEIKKLEKDMQQLTAELISVLK